MEKACLAVERGRMVKEEKMAVDQAELEARQAKQVSFESFIAAKCAQ